MERSPGRPRVLVAEDHPLYRKAVVDAVRERPELDLAGEAADGRAALAAMRTSPPDVALVDVRMPLLDGFGVLRAVVRERMPTRVVMLSAELDLVTIHAALAAGACGYLVKDVGGDEICDAILAAARGETALAPRIRTSLGQAAYGAGSARRRLLTAREQEILELVAEGLSAPDIAGRLVVSPATVRTHLQHLYDKLRVSDRAAAVAEGMRRGLLK